MEPLESHAPPVATSADPAALDAASVDAMHPLRGRPEFAQLRTRPRALVEPATVDDVVALVRWAAATRTALVPRGGGSGLMGGAAVIGPAIAVDLRRLATIHVDADGCLVRAGAGATLARVDAALAPHGLMLAHDPWTVGVATIGGVVATNGLGYLGARAGNVAAQLRAIEVVLADGRVVRTPPAPARSAGLDLTRLFVGTEGTLGIVTEATLAVLPRPEERIVAAYRLSAFDDGVRIAVELRRTGVRWSCFELSADALPPAPATLLVVCDGIAGEARLHADRVARAVRERGGEARPEAEAEREWNERHAIAERWAARSRFRPAEWRADARPDQFDYAHVAVPPAGLAAVREDAHALVRRHGLRLLEEGLWHWPELYSIVVTGPPAAAAGVRATIDGVCRAAQDAGGTMEYCHGVGWKLAHLMPPEHGAAGLDVLRRVKAALDPAGILNPGKVLPT
ncbi:MAG TPA: FAD-binding oxidoreductase [Candidatus Binatia bacterium]|nr:FAD-binding oxidoreductase [Candidatus Binatia bacterium]